MLDFCAEGRGFDPQLGQVRRVFLHLKQLCSSVRHIAHLYCLAVQAGFYGDVVESLLHMRSVEYRRFDPQPG